MSRRNDRTNHPRRNLSLYLDEELYNRIDRMALNEDRSISWMAVHLIQDALKHLDYALSTYQASSLNVFTGIDVPVKEIATP